MSQSKQVLIYNPRNIAKDELIENFVVRTKTYEDIFNDLKSSDMKNPEQHIVVQGVRGQGKTTLLYRVYYQVQNDKAMSKKIIPVIFTEEQYNIVCLNDLWETTADYLESHDGFNGLFDEMDAIADKEDYDFRCFELLENRLKKNKQKLILFVDNIGELLQKFIKRDHQRLREILQESAEIRLVGASSVMLEFKYENPFYNFFRIVTLKGLNASDTTKLLKYLGKAYDEKSIEDVINCKPERIESIRRMTGGVLRTIVLLFDIFLDCEGTSAFDDLEKLLDQVTPLYKHRMDDLTPQQQKIIDTIALNWDAMSTQDIAKKTRLQSKAISSQIKQMKKYNLIEVVETKTKNHLYRISERYFNIWYLMRQSNRRGVNRVRFLVEFLEMWCDQDELKNRTLKLINAIDSGRIQQKQAAFLSAAFSQTPIPDELQDTLVSKANSYVKEENISKQYGLSRSNVQILKEVDSLLVKKDYISAIKLLNRIRHESADVHFAKGLMYFQLKDYEKAYEYLTNANDKGQIYASIILGGLHSTKMYDFNKAEKYLLNSLELDINDGNILLAELYFSESTKKEKALNILLNLSIDSDDFFANYIYAKILLWNNKFEKVIDVAWNFIEKSLDNTENANLTLVFLLLLLAKKQYHTALKLFHESKVELKEGYKPVYYALMYFLQEEYPNEYLKMGEELRETVEEILVKIEKIAIDYV